MKIALIVPGLALALVAGQAFAGAATQATSHDALAAGACAEGLSEARTSEARMIVRRQSAPSGLVAERRNARSSEACKQSLASSAAVLPATAPAQDKAIAREGWIRQR